METPGRLELPYRALQARAWAARPRCREALARIRTSARGVETRCSSPLSYEGGRTAARAAAPFKRPPAEAAAAAAAARAAPCDGPRAARPSPGARPQDAP